MSLGTVTNAFRNNKNKQHDILFSNYDEDAGGEHYILKRLNVTNVRGLRLWGYCVKLAHYVSIPIHFI